MLRMRDWQVHGEPLLLGYVGEHQARTVEIALDGDYTDWAFKLDVRLPNGRPWALDLTRDENGLSCTVDRGLLTMPGDVTCTLRGVSGEVIRESNLFAAVIRDAVDAQDSLPPLPESEFAQMERKITEMKAGTETAAASAQKFAEDAEESRKQAGEYADASKQSETGAKDAQAAAERAKSETEKVAQETKENTDIVLRRAEEAADRAEQAILANGYAEFAVGEDGVLRLYRTANLVDKLDFALDEETGRLEAKIYG